LLWEVPGWKKTDSERGADRRPMRKSNIPQQKISKTTTELERTGKKKKKSGRKKDIEIENKRTESSKR